MIWVGGLARRDHFWDHFPLKSLKWSKSIRCFDLARGITFHFRSCRGDHFCRKRMQDLWIIDLARGSLSILTMQSRSQTTKTIGKHYVFHLAWSGRPVAISPSRPNRSKSVTFFDLAWPWRPVPIRPSCPNRSKSIRSFDLAWPWRSLPIDLARGQLSLFRSCRGATLHACKIEKPL